MYRFWVCQEMQFPDEITQKKKVRRASSLIIASRYVPYVGTVSYTHLTLPTKLEV